jgi:hypothetical protein
MVRPALIGIVLCTSWLRVGIGDEAALRDKAEGSLKRGLAYLAAHQAENGGWHSTTYGQLKGGPGVTALALYAFSRAPAELRQGHPQLANRGYAFFGPGFAKKGSLAATDGSLDYPTYAGALWLISRKRLGLPGAVQPGQPGEQQIVDYLLAAQLLEARGFDPSSPSHGGWDFLGAGEAQGITTGSNISLAAFILDALADQSDDRREIKVARESALAWIERTQQADGGFAFTPEPGSLNNKALFSTDDDDRQTPRSYGTATSDGIRALAALGVSSDDQRMQRAVKWLAEHPSLDVVPGFEALPPEAGWQRGLRYYYYASLAEAQNHFPAVDRGARRTALLKVLVDEQRKDGSWMNESPRMREDDPLIATSFAVAALGALLEENVPGRAP